MARPLDAGARRFDQRFGEVDSGDLGAGDRGGERHAGRAGAAADVEDARPRKPRKARAKPFEQSRLERLERAVGPPPFLGPGLADPAAPFECVGHAVLLAWLRGNWNLPARRDLGRAGLPPFRDFVMRPTEPGMPGKREFVLLIAALMASNALAIDAMLPALPAIGAALDVAEENKRQLVITAYLMGFGISQLFYGPLADRFGRKPLLIFCLGFYALFAALAGLAGSFDLLLLARGLQGVAAGGTRVLVVAIVRDRFHGSAMAQVMSLVMIVFMAVPVLAPSLGQAILFVGSWRHIFIALALYGVGLALWGGTRLPETLADADRLPLSPRAILGAVGETLSVRASIGNTIASTLAFGGLFAFIGSIQQIVFDVFESPNLIGLVFACVAGPMALSSYANSRLVMRLGARRLLLSALAALTLIASLHLAIVAIQGEIALAVRRADGIDARLLRAGRRQCRRAGDGESRSYRRHRLIGAGAGHDQRRRIDRAGHRPGVRRHHHALARGLRALRRARSARRSLGESEGRARRSRRGPALIIRKSGS